MKQIVLFSVLSVCAIVCEWAFGISAHRSAHLDYQVVAKRYRPKIVDPYSVSGTASSPTVYGSAVKFADLDISSAPLEKNIDKLFQYIRDNRELKDPAKTSFVRRIPWMYPEDGCWVRAALASQWAVREKYAQPLKLFIFGNLHLKSANSVAGSVTWWFHVVAAVRDKAGDLFVIDPAIDSSAPIGLKDWVLKMVSDVGDVKLSLCSSYSYEPYDACEITSSSKDANAVSDVDFYLTLERSNLSDLGRKEDELGDSPPWK